MGCTRSLPSILQLALAAGVLLGAARLGAEPSNRCLECHLLAAEPTLRAPAEQVPASVHRHAELGCVGCHGGDPADPTARAHAPDRGYVGRPPPQQVAALCGDCHADGDRIRKLGADLPLDQRELYRASRHGELVAAGDGAAPTCTSCHGHHDTLAATDARSRAHPGRVADQCGSCHADAETMAAYSISTQQLAQWQRSAHGEAFRRGVDDAPSCTGCHGAHREVRGDAAAAAAGCADCHEPQFEQYRHSPHAEPFAQQGLAPCVPCHGSHDVPRVPPLSTIFGPDGTCNRCHAEDESVAEAIATLARSVEATSTRAAVARQRLEHARRDGVQAAETAVALSALDDAEGALRLAIHSLEQEALAEPLRRVASAVSHAEQLAQRVEARRRVMQTALPVGAGLAAVLVVGLLILRSRRRAGRRGV